MKKPGKLLSIVLAVALSLSIFTVPDFPVKASSPENPETLSADNNRRGGNTVTNGGVDRRIKAAGITSSYMSLNNSWISGNIGVKDEVDFYSFTITKAGWVTVLYQGHSIGDSYVQILDKDLSKEYAKANVYTSSNQAPKTKDFRLALEAGTYYVKIWGYGNHTGDYKLKGSFEAANNNEREINNDFSTAMPLNKNQTVTGFISIDDRLDFYKISVPPNKGIRLIYTSYIGDSYLEVWNSDFINIHTKNHYGSISETSPRTYVYENEENLPAGTYYVKIRPYGSHTGKYVLKYEYKIPVNSIKVSGKKQMIAGTSTRLTATVNPSNATHKDISWSSGNTSIASVDNKGKVTAHSVGKVNITASATDGSNRTKIFTIIVTPKKMQRPYVYNSGKRKMYVSWRWQSGVSGYKVQYSKKKNFKGARTIKVSKNRTSRTISKLSKSKYYVRVCAYYKSGRKTYNGKWSSVKSVRIRK